MLRVLILYDSTFCAEIQGAEAEGDEEMNETAAVEEEEKEEEPKRARRPRKTVAKKN